MRLTEAWYWTGSGVLATDSIVSKFITAKSSLFVDFFNKSHDVIKNSDEAITKKFLFIIFKKYLLPKIAKILTICKPQNILCMHNTG